MTALNFPASPSSGDVHNAANGLQYAFDGVKWTSQGTYDTGAINAQKLDSIASSFNGSTTTFNLKVNNNTIKPHNEQSVSIVLNGHLQEPVTAYTTSQTNGTITFATPPAAGTTFFGVLLSRLPVTSNAISSGSITNASVAANAAIDGTKINPNFGSQNITTTGSITGTTTTQSATDNTTKLASTAFVQTAIANLVDSSPDTLNTLNELAAALGDDADFSTTITTALAGKAPLASPTFTGTVSGVSYDDLDDLPTGAELTTAIASTEFTESVQDIVGAMVTGNTETGINVTYDDAGDGTGKLNFATTTSSSSSQTFDDNVKAIFGTSNDGLEIYHDSNNSIIDDTGTGSLLIFGSNVIIQESGTSNVIADFHPNTVKLYKNNKEKLVTTDNGIEIKGDSSNSTDGSIQLNCSANSHGVKIKSPNHSAGQSYTIILPDNQIAVNKILKVKSISGSGSTAIGQLEFADDSTGSSLTSSNINAAFGDTTQLILGAADGDGDDALKLFYGPITSGGTQYGVLTADTGLQLQFDGSTKLETTSTGVDISGDLNIQKTTGANLVKIIGGEGERAELQLWADDGDDSSDKWHLRADQQDYFQIAGLGSDGAWNAAFYAVPNGRSELLYDGVKKLETGTTYVRVTGDLDLNNDNHKILLGESQDLKIYHDSNNSIIDGTGTGGLLFYASDIIFHEKSDASHKIAEFSQDSSTGCKLYYDNSPKFQTTNTGVSVTGNITTGDQITLSGTNPHITFTDSNNNPDFEIYGSAGIWQVWDSTNNVGRLVVNSDGHIDIAGNLDVGAGLDVTGNITVTGTVDGVDIAALNTTVSGIASPTATTINALYPDNGNLILGTGTGDDTLKLYYDGTNGYITADNGVQLQYNGSTKLETTANGAAVTGKLGINLAGTDNTSPVRNLDIADSSGAILRLISSDDTLGANERLGEIEFYSDDDDNAHIGAFIKAIADGSDAAGRRTTLTFGTQNHDASVNAVEMMRLDCNGKVGIGTISPSGLLHCRGASATAIIEGTEGTNAKLILKADDGDDPEDIWQLESHPNGYFAIQSLGNNTTGAHFYAVPNGRSELLYDDSKKLETTTTGVTVTGVASTTSLSINSTSGYIGLPDSAKIFVGTGNDLQIYHDGNHSYINNNTQYLQIQSNYGVLLQRHDGSENLIRALSNAAVELYYDGSKKFETHTNGVHMSGSMYFPDNEIAGFGDVSNPDLRIYHDGGGSYVTNKTGILRLQAKAGENSISLIPDGAAELYFDHSKKLETGTTYVRITGDLSMNNDNHRILLGASQDLQLYHSSNNNYIDAATGMTTFIRTAGTENAIAIVPNGTVELYHDNSKKFETTSYGATMGGLLFLSGSGYVISTNDNGKIALGDSVDLQIYHDGSHSYIQDVGTGNLRLLSNSGILSNTDTFTVNNGANSENMIAAFNGGAVKLYYDGSLKFETMSTGAKWHGDLFCDDNQYLKIGSSADLQIFHEGNNTYVVNTGGQLLLRSTTGVQLGAPSGEPYASGVENGTIQLYWDNSLKLKTVSSGVDISGTLRPDANNSRDLGASDRRWATIYAVNALNTSDENEKKDINNCDLGLDFVNKINPVSYKWKDAQLGSKTHYGLLAQNIEDAVKSEGKTLNDFGAIHKPEQESMALNYNQLIAPLVKAIQELSAKVVALEST